ncbi:MAG TPA: AI-2E family transporter [Bryobacteraceae bacterium]|nr:AI-2E family transporter [Bryobacteraceae bacterium]
MLGLEPRAARYTWTAAILLLGLWVLFLIRSTLFIFVIALMFAYLLYPLLDAIERRLTWKTRTPALAVTFVLVLGLLIVFGVFIGRHVGAEAAQLADQIRNPDFARKVKEWTVLRVPVGAQIVEHYDEILRMLPSLSLRVLSASRNLIYLIVIPILSFFILKDGREIRDTFLDFFDGARETAQETLRDAHILLLQYMRSLLFLCLATLITFTVVLSLMSVPYAILLAAVAFPLEFVPLVGPLAAAALIIGVSGFSGYPHVIGVIIFLGAYRLFQDYVLSPHLMSRGVKLHPLMVIFGVFAGGEIGGIPGVFLSVPALALLRLLWHHLRKRRVVSRRESVLRA